MNIPVLAGFEVDRPTTAPTTSISLNYGALNTSLPYQYVVTFITGYGETVPGPASASVTTRSGSIQITSIPVSPNGNVSSRRIYRTVAGGSSFFFLTSIGGNFPAKYTDIKSDSMLSTPPPVINTAESKEEILGDLFLKDPLNSLVVTGRPPFVIASSTLVSNLYVARAVSADNAGGDVPVFDVSTNAVFYPTFAPGTSGVQPTNVNDGLTFNPSTGILSTNQLQSNVSNGNPPLIVVSNTLVPNLYVDRAVLADSVSSIAVTSVSTNATFYPTFVSATSGNLPIDTNSEITCNPATGLLSASQLQSTVSTGTAPIVVASNTLVPNLYVARAVSADNAGVLGFGSAAGDCGAGGMPDYSATVAIGTPFPIPQDIAYYGSVSRNSSSAFTLAIAGMYRVTFQTSIDEPGQVAVWLDPNTGIFAAVPHTRVGRATGTCQCVIDTVIIVSVPNSKISVYNDASPAALTVTPNAGGTNGVSTTITIVQLI